MFRATAVGSQKTTASRSITLYFSPVAVDIPEALIGSTDRRTTCAALLDFPSL